MPDSTTIPTTASRIRAARLAAGLTQVQLAARMGLAGQGVVSCYERGTKLASLDTLTRLAAAIGCRPSDLDGRLRD